MTGVSAKVTDTYELDTFGRSVSSSGSTPNPYRFGGAWGYITDPSGMLQLGARFYWPEIGRFISQDPIGEGGNWYAYAGSNPVVRVDPNGRTWVDWGGVAECLKDSLNPFVGGPGALETDVMCLSCAYSLIALGPSAGASSIFAIPSCTVCGANGFWIVALCLHDNTHPGPNPNDPCDGSGGPRGPRRSGPPLPVPGGIAPPGTPWDTPGTPTYY